MDEEKFYSPTDRVLGIFTVVVSALGLLALLTNEEGRDEYVVISGILLVGTIGWGTLVRPQIRLTPTTLTLRTPLAIFAVPLQLVADVEVRRYTKVVLPDGELASTAVSRGTRELVRLDSGRKSPDGDPAAFMIERIKARVVECRARAGADEASVRRTRAWPEIVLLVVSAVGLVVALLV